ncbi:MAG: flagellar hook-associated protein FlgL, partial [Planctomycetales bacterium]|nr:flagellar hook-associated protein FlgL [Planctomycetales bacterium]
MTSISPIPTGRISDTLINSRLLAQLQINQQDIFAVQNQLSTGRRISRPSEDAPSAIRAISLQRLIERKTQVQVNLQTNQSYLSATDTALNGVSSVISDIRGAALSVADTTSTDAQRTAIAAEVQRAIQQLVDTGNQQFRGRYLFAGSRTTVLPFTYQDGYVAYRGNESELQSYSDIDVLFESSIAGTEVFGAISEAVLGSADLNPVLTADTLLRDLHGGRGITDGSIAVSDGASIATVDISQAETIGDVARLIETNPPAGRSITVSVRPTGLYIEIDDAGGGNLTITEVAGGTTAKELGILEESGTLTNPVEGNDLDPILRLGTQIDQIFGSRAQGRIQSAGVNNDITLQATEIGTQYNDVTVQFVDDSLQQAAPGVAAGSEYANFEANAVASRAALTFAGANNDLVLEATAAGADFNNVTVKVTSTAVGVPTASYDSTNKVLTIDLEADGSSTANDVIGAIGAISGTPFSASLDTSIETTNTGGGAIAAFTDANFASTGNSGGDAGTLYVHIDPGDTLAYQVVDAINAEGTFQASIDPRDAVIAAQAGFGAVDPTATASTAGGGGFAFDATGIQITNGGETFELSFATAETIEDVLNIINGSGAGVLAQISPDGDSINIRSRLSGADFSIGENGGETATQLGIRTFTENSRLDSLNDGLGVNDFPGDDFSIETSDGTVLAIDVSGAETIADILDRINTHADNPGNV